MLASRDTTFATLNGRMSRYAIRGTGYERLTRTRYLSKRPEQWAATRSQLGVVERSRPSNSGTSRCMLITWLHTADSRRGESSASCNGWRREPGRYAAWIVRSMTTNAQRASRASTLEAAHWRR
eukprot:1799712-Pleurochrysis_carterae.AAC.2